MNDRLIIIAGPCVIESKENIMEIASYMAGLVEKYDIDYYFKASFDKANRSSIDSYRGPGIRDGLDILREVKGKFGFKIVTDIHEPYQAEIVAEVCDVVQIPAFLCRQTDLLVAAARTQKIINVKKAQFFAPWDMKNVIDKIKASGNERIWLCERGSTFGYNNLVVDMTSICLMKKYGFPVIFDATHSVQKPGGNGTSTGGNREFVEPLAKAAAAVGADGLFFEIHPDPDKALSDGPNMIKLPDFEDVLRKVIKIHEAL